MLWFCNYEHIWSHIGSLEEMRDEYVHVLNWIVSLAMLASCSLACNSLFNI
jgi:hypothetical protein